MKFLLTLALVTFGAICSAAQTPSPSPTPERTTSDDATTVGAQITPKMFKGIYSRPNSKTRFNRYAKSIFGPVALGKTVVSAGYSTWRNSPEEWGPTWEGFGRRFASGLGKNAIKQTTIYTLGEAFKLDSGFYRSTKKNTGGRLGDALLSTFVARKPNGTKVFGFPRIAGTYTASVIAAETWYPKRFTYKDGLKSGTISLGLNVAFNVVKEFFFKK
jgi:hypothetical protein